MEFLKKRLNEELSLADVDKKIKIHLDSTELKNKVEKIVKDRIKNDKELDDKVVEITKNVITQLYKTLFNKRAFWRSNLINKAN